MTKKEASCLGQCARVLYLVVNFLVWIFGLILISVGGFILQNLHIYAFVYLTDPSQLSIGCWILIGLGCLVFLVGFNGVWACVKESVPWMKVYFVFMMLIIIGGLASGIISLLSRNEARTTVKNNMVTIIQEEYGKGGIIDEGYDNIHQSQECCGEDGPVDWKDSYFSTLPENINPPVAVPQSCCKPKIQTGCNSGSPGVPTNPALVFSEGCGGVIANFQVENMTTVGLISLIMVGLETLSLILVCCVIGTRPIPEKSDTDEVSDTVVEEGVDDTNL